MRTLVLLALVAIHWLAACASVEYSRTTSRDTEAAYRAFLVDHPEGDEAERARDRLRALAFQRASRGDDVAAYNRFLAGFPQGDFASEARERRARARLRRALEQGGSDPLRRLIESDPETRAAQQARDRLEQLEAAAVSSSDEPGRLRAFLLAFPDSEARDRVQRRLDDLDFAAARQDGRAAALRAYLQEHPRGVHRAEALEALEALEADEVIASGRYQDMERYLQRNPGSTAEARVRAALASALIERAEVLLDERLARRALALEPESAVALRARALLESWERGGRRLEQERELIVELAGPLDVRDAEALRDALEATDLLQAWTAVREVALSRDPATLDVAVEAAGSGDPLLLFYARIALAARADDRGQRARSILTRRADQLRRRRSNPEDLLRFGAVSEAVGEADEARRAYRGAAQREATAVAGAAHWALLAAERGSPDERDEAASALADRGRQRTEELLDLIPEEIDADTLAPALRVLRGMEALHRVVAAVVERLAPVTSGELEIPAPAARDDLIRLGRALEAAARRLTALLRLQDPAVRPADSQDPLAAAAAARRQRRVIAAQRLGELRAARAIPALVEVASRDGSEVGRESLRALARMRSTQARTALLELSRSESLPGAGLDELIAALRAAARGAPAGARRELNEAAERLGGGTSP